jgi:hypothetical protein
MSEYIETINGSNWSTVNSRCLEHDGCIVDLGCYTWDWSIYFKNKKRVVGVDPFELKVEWADLFKGVISDHNGYLNMHFDGYGSTLFPLPDDIYPEHSLHYVTCLTWKDFCHIFNVDKISVLKINIEKSEYKLIETMDEEDFSKIDQILISFHNFLDPNLDDATVESIRKIESMGFKSRKVNEDWSWFLFEKIYD